MSHLKPETLLVARKVRGMGPTSVLHRKHHMQLIANQQRDEAVSKIVGGSETDADRSHFHGLLKLRSSALQQICRCPKPDHSMQRMPEKFASSQTWVVIRKTMLDNTGSNHNGALLHFQKDKSVFFQHQLQQATICAE